MTNSVESIRARQLRRRELLAQAREYGTTGRRGLAHAYLRAAKCERRHIRRLVDHATQQASR